jgi:hypothetical protein
LRAKVSAKVRHYIWYRILPKDGRRLRRGRGNLQETVRHAAEYQYQYQYQ